MTKPFHSTTNTNCMAQLPHSVFTENREILSTQPTVNYQLLIADQNLETGLLPS